MDAEGKKRNGAGRNTHQVAQVNETKGTSEEKRRAPKETQKRILPSVLETKKVARHPAQEGAAKDK